MDATERHWNEHETARVQLNAVAALLEDPAHWVKGIVARDFHGQYVEPGEDTACAWCLYGALCRVMRKPADEASETTAFSILMDAIHERVIEADDYDGLPHGTWLPTLGG